MEQKLVKLSFGVLFSAIGISMMFFEQTKPLSDIVLGFGIGYTISNL